MINALKYKVTFPKTGRTFEGDLSFAEGMTAISGPNEAGKSLSLEFVRYALFGSRALRGEASDYKTLDLELQFQLRGENYVVVRKGNKAHLFDGMENQIATGTKPVNEAIVRMFGYGLDVFDMANNCSQGEIERLGAMKPTERKALVDRTIGLDAIDRAAKRVNNHLADARTRVETLEENLVEPEAPEQPEGYHPSEHLRSRLADARRDHDAAVAARAWLDARSDLTPPVRPDDPEPQLSHEGLRESEQARRAKLDRVGEINSRIARLREPLISVAEIDRQAGLIEQNNAWNNDQRKLREHPAPRFSEKVLGHIERAQEAARKRVHIERLREDTVECPSCGHEWFAAEDAIDQIREGLPLYDDDVLPEGWETVDVEQERSRAQAHEKLELSGAKRPEEEPAYTTPQLELERELHQEWASCQPLQDEAKELLASLPEDLSSELQAKEAYLEQLREFEAHQEKWDQFQTEKADRETQLAEAEKNEDIPRIDELSSALEGSIAYEANLKSYQTAKERYDEQMEKLAERREERDQWNAARSTLRDLKASIKTHLIPSLNTVASALITKMTGGDRNKILIDEDFNIDVDGQPLNTLSGSGKAVANLAIRLGLGQVLTNKTFSVFMADEIDASMDQDRAGFTTECLSALAGTISQVVLVSHKQINAPNMIEIGASYGQPDSPRSGDDQGRAA